MCALCPNRPRTPAKGRATSLVGRSDGVALLLVMFVVALASILVVGLAYSAHLSARVSNNIQHGLQAEYLLKSAVNVARTLIHQDGTSEDSEKDVWAQFSHGIRVPPGILDLRDSRAAIDLEITPEESRIPLRAIVQGDSVGKKWRSALLRLFQEFRFDEDGEPDQTGLGGEKRVFTSEELLANLVDYMDADTENFSDPAVNATGFEKDLPEGVTFPNQMITRLGELSGVPGFSAARLRLISPFLTVYGNNKVNINLAPRRVLLALHPELDESKVDQIISFRSSEEGPFTKIEQITSVVGDAQLVDELSPMIKFDSSFFQVIAKVTYGDLSYLARASLYKPNKNVVPELRSLELF